LLVDPEQGLARERLAQPVAQELVKRSRAERSDPLTPHGVRSERALESRRLRCIGEPSGEQHEDPARPEPSQRERKRGRRRRIEPLDVIDSHHDRLPIAQKLQHVAHRDGHRTLIDRVTKRLVSQHRDLERAPPRRRERGQGLVEDILEQIAQAHVGEAAFGLHRTRRQHAQAPPACMIDPRQPESGLADPCLAHEHERSRLVWRVVDEPSD
jgi:hypothetical protein